MKNKKDLSNINKLFQKAAHKLPKDLAASRSVVYSCDLENGGNGSLKAKERTQVKALAGFQAFEKACRKVGAKYSFSERMVGDENDLYVFFKLQAKLKR